jgi:hypothetical protein
MELKNISHSQVHSDFNVTLTSIILKDPLYSFQVTLFYKTWHKENIIEQWTEIQHHEEKAVQLKSMLQQICILQTRIFILTSFATIGQKRCDQSKKTGKGVRSFESVLGTRQCFCNHQTSSSLSIILLQKMKEWSFLASLHGAETLSSTLKLTLSITSVNCWY